ncbi:Rieske (2Fe-2S) protein [Saccharothrix algeriensis]|uniref:Nitrite reductase/ring-hydroxylating ferredoxin subunit n=1 Tax=Saccharothrix algeriensis TaxID=173560 RepID=A0A8T8HVS1_9PSEU|nr:Rieske (2Fe-2S) protein [Saccharothrix algeriensis]MBM7814061.1 nitrite reductase/ring-hydroxylating ferredoxin subunit [Saccharothrix algeriensis]QTR02459.1 Rieske (2Fe-2S) protein [Saccharothrix algeriensis]
MSTTEDPVENRAERPGPSRRSVLCGVLVALAVPGGLAACGTSGPPAGTTGGGTPTGGSSPATGGAPAGGVVALSEVPDGGGVVVEAGGRQLVVTRTGEVVKAFDAACPHAGTPVAAPADGTITCPNHGSRFSAADGSLMKGPATRGLTEVPVEVRGDQVVLA